MRCCTQQDVALRRRAGRRCRLSRLACCDGCLRLPCWWQPSSFSFAAKIKQSLAAVSCARWADLHGLSLSGGCHSPGCLTCQPSTEHGRHSNGRIESKGSSRRERVMSSEDDADVSDALLSSAQLSSAQHSATPVLMTPAERSTRCTALSRHHRSL